MTNSNDALAAVLERHREKLLAIPGVSGVGLGEAGGHPCILIVCDPAIAPGALPEQLEGYPVRVQGGGPVTAG